MESLATLITVAIFIESVISYGETVYNKGSIQWQIVIAMIISGIICYDTKVNFFAIFGLTERFPLIGTIATAMVLCRGSNYMFELYNHLSTWRSTVATGQIIAQAATGTVEPVSVTATTPPTNNGGSSIQVVPDQTPEVKPVMDEMLAPQTEEIEQEDVKAAKR